MNASSISSLFWAEWIWLPPGVTWAMLEPTPEKPYANFYHLLLPIFGAFVMMTLRHVFERWVFRPWGLRLGIKPRTATLNPEISAAIQSGPDQISALAKRKDLSERQVERLVRRYHALKKPEKLAKFSENSWRCLFYTTMTLYGCVTLYDKPWTWSVTDCWLGYPKHYITPDVWWYYMIELSFYWALMVSQFTDVKRKDFTQMFIHHCATILLMSFSWACNLTRVGTLVLIVHDVADIFLESAKMAKYAGRLNLCNVFFALFTIVWIISRLGIFPFKIIYSCALEAPTLYPTFPAYYIFNILLLCLMCLHIFWTYWIVQGACKTIAAGHMEKDVRSSSEEELTEDEGTEEADKNGDVQGLRKRKG